MEDTQVIKFDDSVSAQALTELQEHIKLLPTVITTEKEFKSIYKNYQNVRRLRTAVGKQSEELVKSFKKTFELGKKEIQEKESVVLDILTPIENKLKSTREAWEIKKKEIADADAAELAAEQEKEFNRTDIIRKWDQAHLDNQAHDQKILDDIERVRKDKELAAREKELEIQEEERIKERKAEADKLEADRLKFEQEKADFEKSKNRVDFAQAWVEAHEKNELIKIAEPTQKGREALEKEGVKIEAPTQTRLEQMIEDEQEQDCIEGEAKCPECGHKFDIHSY